jgi:hypothetical protein
MAALLGALSLASGAAADPQGHHSASRSEGGGVGARPVYAPRAYPPGTYGPGPGRGPVYAAPAYPAPYGYRGYPPAYGSPAYAPSAQPHYGFGGGDWRAQQMEVRQAVREGRHVPLSQAIQAVRRLTPGRQLDTGLETGPGGRTLYRVRWAASDGRRIDYLVDAATGAILGVQGGR